MAWSLGDMVSLQLYRFHQDDEGTIGILLANGEHLCLIGELPWRDNLPNVSRIPAGTYQVDYLERSASGRYQDVYHVRDVPGRSGVLFHSGNWTGDTVKGLRSNSHGCLITGSRLGRLQGQRAVLASRVALDKLRTLVGRNDFTLEIHDD